MSHPSPPFSGIVGSEVQEVFLGNVVSAGIGQAPARQAVVYSGLHKSTCVTTINKVCSSGMKAAMLGAQQIRTGEVECLVAGGFESMSNIPYIVPKVRRCVCSLPTQNACISRESFIFVFIFFFGSHSLFQSKVRTGLRYGHGELLDGILRDGLEDAFEKVPMVSWQDTRRKKNSDVVFTFFFLLFTRVSLPSALLPSTRSLARTLMNLPSSHTLALWTPSRFQKKTISLLILCRVQQQNPNT